MGDLAAAAARAEAIQTTTELELTRNELNELRAEYTRVRELLGVMTTVDAKRKGFEWKTKAAKPGRRRSVVTSMLSDLHFDEVVAVDELNGVNAYDRRIALKRLQRYTEKACSLPRDLMQGYDYDGFHLMLNGDVLSGDIHAELRRTNAGTISEGIAFWIDPLNATIRKLAEAYGRVTVDVTAGNHGRNPLEKRSPAKQRAADNFDTLIGWLLERDFRDHPNVEVRVARGTDLRRTVYSTTFLQTHGDQAKGGSGISGALAPLMLFAHRKAKRQSAVDQPYDIMVIGHWHQYMALPGQGLIVNGSLKGYDEYAFVSNFPFEEPQQALWLTTPEHGVSVSMPIQVMDRKAEGW